MIRRTGSPSPAICRGQGRWVHRFAAAGLAVAALSAASGLAVAQDDEPLAPELLAAKTIFVRQTLIDPKIVSRFRSEIAKWEHFEVVASEEEADIVATLAADVEYTQTVSDSTGAGDEDAPGESGRAGASGPRPMGTVRVLEDIHLLITTPDGAEVWRDAVPAGSMTGNSSKKLAKRLRARIEDEGV